MLNLLNRRIIEVTGDDTFSFLQGLISNDINLLQKTPMIYSAFLTPQGKFLYDFFITRTKNGVLIDIYTPWAEAFMKKLTLYKLRSKVSLALRDDLKIYATFPRHPEERSDVRIHASSTSPGSLDFARDDEIIDPRLAEMGARLITSETLQTTASEEDYHKHRIDLGVPEGCMDLTQEHITLLEASFDDLNGVNFDKGCYLGQELTARTKYRGLVRKKIFIIESTMPLPARFEKLTYQGKNIGEMAGSIGKQGLALMRIEHFYNAPIFTDDRGQSFTLIKPSFLTLPSEDEVITQ